MCSGIDTSDRGITRRDTLVMVERLLLKVGILGIAILGSDISAHAISGRLAKHLTKLLVVISVTIISLVSFSDRDITHQYM